MAGCKEAQEMISRIPGVTLDIDACFSSDYTTARGWFLSAAGAAGAEVTLYRNPNKGPNGGPLATDVALFGRRDAERVLVMVSATHGVEGFCGSAAQLDWMTGGGPERLPAGVAVLLLHAINPYGFAWLRRTTEEGVDLNRNCISFDEPLPANEGYAELADDFLPRSRETEALESAMARLAAWREVHGARAFTHAHKGGQYSHPEGFYFGGTEATWSRRTLEQIASDYGLAARTEVGVIDFHTGLGPFGYGEPIVGHRPGEPGQARCRHWYGHSLGEPLLGTSASLPIGGLTQYTWGREVGQERLTFIALEFGTFDPTKGLTALRDDHWLHAYGSVAWKSDETQAIKIALRNHFNPPSPDWREMVLLRSRQVVVQALEGLERASG